MYYLSRVSQLSGPHPTRAICLRAQSRASLSPNASAIPSVANTERSAASTLWLSAARAEFRNRRRPPPSHFFVALPPCGTCCFAPNICSSLPFAAGSGGPPRPAVAARFLTRLPNRKLSSAASNAATRSKANGDPTSPPALSRPRPSRRRPAVTGRSKTSCTGFST